MYRQQYGYTLIELATVTAIIVLLTGIGLPQFARAKDKSKEDEAKSNLRTLQIAIERYAVDNGEYPRYLLGGDTHGWDAWHKKWDGVNKIEMSGDRLASNEKVSDPLIKYGYLDSYPGNPFTDDKSAVISATNVSGSREPGDGDPRFGFSGDLMGQGLDDMNFFKGAVHKGAFFWSEIETRRTLDRGEWMNVQAYFKNPETNMYYLFGGRRVSNSASGNKTTFTFWAGNFFYKSAPDVMLPSRHGWTLPAPNTNSVGGWRDRYILGVYGGFGTEGLDVIRLEPTDPDGNPVKWQCPPPLASMRWACGYEDMTRGLSDKPGGLPEVFGGGDERTGPWWYYNEGGRNSGEFIHGAPDGVPDGVILVLTESANPFMEYEDKNIDSGGES